MPSSDNAQRQFDVLYQTLCDIQTRLLDSNSKVAGFLLLATGWMATSKDARQFLQSEPHARGIVIAALVGAFVLYVCASFQAWWISRQTLSLLNNLSFLPENCYKQRRVPLSTLLIFSLGNGCLAALTVFFVWTLH
jgi:hypothetical protein